jgi:hypothetical protein
MKIYVLFSTIVLATMSTHLFAQHSDIEFGYDDVSNPASFIIESDNFTSDNFLLFESEMEERDPFDAGNFSSDEPGFTTNDAEDLLVNAGDQVFLEVLDASQYSDFGVGFVNYYNPTTNSLEALGRLAINDNSDSTADLVLNGASVESGPNPQFLGLGDDDGDIHDHVVIDLLDDATAPEGAYGLLLQLRSDFATGDGDFDLDSDPFWIVWNHGMDDSDFDSLALPAFGAVPEPSSACMLGLGVVTLVIRRRRRIA